MIAWVYSPQVGQPVVTRQSEMEGVTTEMDRTALIARASFGDRVHRTCSQIVLVVLGPTISRVWSRCAEISRTGFDRPEVTRREPTLLSTCPKVVRSSVQRGNGCHTAKGKRAG